MINFSEKRILEILEKGHVMTKSEVMSILQKENCNGATEGIVRLKDRGMIDSVQNMGNYVVMTKKGMRALKGRE